MNASRQSSRASNHKTVRALILVPLLVMSVVAAACGQDPLPTLAPLPTHTAFPTLEPLPTLAPLPTYTPFPEPTATPTPRPIPTPNPDAPVTYTVERFSFGNRDRVPGFELRMGNLTAWGYNAGDRISGHDPDGIKITLKTNDVLFIERVMNPSRTSTEPRGFFSDELGFRVELYPDVEIAFLIRDVSCSASNCGGFNTREPGIYVIGDPFDSGLMGKFVIELTDCPSGPCPLAP